MKSASIPSLKNSIFIELQQVRQNTLNLFTEIEESCLDAAIEDTPISWQATSHIVRETQACVPCDPCPQQYMSTNSSFQQGKSPQQAVWQDCVASLFYIQAHPDFSPIGWHFGHIAFTEAYWILEHIANFPPSFKQYHRLFAADGLPKKERENLPTISAIKEYLDSIRGKVLEYLDSAPTLQERRLWQWLIQHETQHCETISFLWQLHRQRNNQNSLIKFDKFDRFNSSTNCENLIVSEMVEVKAGEFVMGSNAIEAQDNERPAHKIYLNSYWIDRFPVTCKQYRQFMAAEGYQKREYWSSAGWQWLQKNPVSQPLYWVDSTDWDDHPVYGVNYYEAEAYAKFVNKRLPTEAEWSKSALGASKRCNHNHLIGHTTPVNAYADASKYGCRDMLGNVWEWTASWFEGYSGFISYPYSGYSEVYFDGEHRVLKGGSWATGSSGLRKSFRNWYHPHVRQILAGFRCARDGDK